MIKRAILIGVLFAFRSMNAQNFSLLETDVGAIQQVTHLELGSGFPNYHLTLYYVFKGDTVISDRTYHKHYCHKFFGANGHIDMGNFYYGAVRQEGKKIYFYHRDSMHESLFFDFGLNIGDTLPSRLWSDAWGPFYVVSIDSGILNDGVKRRYMGVSPFPPPSQNQGPIYEGITFQSILPLRFIEGSSKEYTDPQTQLCKNGVGIFAPVDFSWPIPNSLICDYFVNTEEFDVGDDGFQIRPSLIQDYFSLWCPSAMHGQPLRIRMYASDGKVLQTLEVQALEKIDLDVGNLPNGPFFVQVWAGNKTFSKIAFKY